MSGHVWLSIRIDCYVHLYLTPILKLGQNETTTRTAIGGHWKVLRWFL